MLGDAVTGLTSTACGTHLIFPLVDAPPRQVGFE